MITASICTIGDEILIGQIVDTNSAKIANMLGEIGIKVSYTISIADDKKEIITRLKNALDETDVVIVTGGLGPTKDDITKDALKELSGSENYRESPEQMEIIRKIMKLRGIELSDLNKRQALVPEKAEVIANPLGTAPSMMFRIGTKLLFSLPGVPYEALGCMNSVIGILKKELRTEDIYHKNILTFGIPESTLAKRIEDWENNLPEGYKLAYLPSPMSGVRLRISKYGGSAKDAEIKTAEIVSQLKNLLGNAVYGEDDDTLQSVVGKILLKYNLTVSTAESCTGGLVSSLLTDVPGSSGYYYGSIISYDNSIKEKILGVSREIIETRGAVSRECVTAMAENARKIMKTDYAVATSGIAGPGGGTQDKPAGTVWIAVSSKSKTSARLFTFNGQREQNKQRFAANALNFLRETILDENR